MSAVSPIDVGNTTALDTISEAALESERDPIVDLAMRLEVRDQDTLELAGSILADQITPLMDKIHESCDPICSATNTAHKAATGQRKSLLAPLEKAESITKGKVSDYLDDQERKRIAAENEARIAREAQEAENRRVQEEHDKKVAEHEKLVREAAERQTQAENEAAESYAEAPTPEPIPEAPSKPEPTMVMEPVPEPDPEPVSGMSARVSWEAEITDPKALLAAIANGSAPMSLIDFNQGKLNSLAKSMDGALPYPGVVCRQKRTVAKRRR